MNRLLNYKGIRVATYVPIPLKLLINNIYCEWGKASVATKRNGRGLFAKQGELSEEKELLLCGVPKVAEWTK